MLFFILFSSAHALLNLNISADVGILPTSTTTTSLPITLPETRLPPSESPAPPTQDPDYETVPGATQSYYNFRLRGDWNLYNKYVRFVKSAPTEYVLHEDTEYSDHHCTRSVDQNYAAVTPRGCRSFIPTDCDYTFLMGSDQRTVACRGYEKCDCSTVPCKCTTTIAHQVHRLVFNPACVSVQNTEYHICTPDELNDSSEIIESIRYSGGLVYYYFNGTHYISNTASCMVQRRYQQTYTRATDSNKANIYSVFGIRCEEPFVFDTFDKLLTLYVGGAPVAIKSYVVRPGLKVGPLTVPIYYDDFEKVYYCSDDHRIHWAGSAHMARCPGPTDLFRIHVAEIDYYTTFVADHRQKDDNSIVSRIIHGANTILSQVTAPVIDLVQTLSVDVQEVIAGTRSLLSLVGDVSSWLLRIEQSLLSFFTSFSKFFVDVPKHILDFTSSLATGFENALHRVLAVFTPFIKLFTDTFSSIERSLLSLVNSIPNHINNFIKGITDAFIRITNMITPILHDINNTFTHLFSEVITEIRATIDKLPELYLTVLRTLFTELRDYLTTLLKWLLSEFEILIVDIGIFTSALFIFSLFVQFVFLTWDGVLGITVASYLISLIFSTTWVLVLTTLSLLLFIIRVRYVH